MPESAAQLRRDAVRRIGDIAGYDDRLDVALTIARPNALHVLVRQALKAAAGDELLLDEVRALFPIGAGKADHLDDAIHVHGLPEPTPDRTNPAADAGPTEDLASVLQEIMR
jgi:hypothetical protein